MLRGDASRAAIAPAFSTGGSAVKCEEEEGGNGNGDGSLTMDIDIDVGDGGENNANKTAPRSILCFTFDVERKCSFRNPVARALEKYLPERSEKMETQVEWVSSQVMQMLVPVFFVICVVSTTCCFLDMNSDAGSPPFVQFMIRQYNSTRGTSLALLDAAINSAAILAVIIITTCFFVYLFAYRRGNTMYSILVVSYVTILALFPAYLAYRALKAYEVPFDYITLVAGAWNIGVAGSYIIFDHALPMRGRVRIQNILLLIIASALVFPFACLPEWTIWCTLLLLIFYDLWAVLTKYGPLRIAMNIQKRRTLMADEFLLPPGMVYEGETFFLGLGDMIFYGVVCARAALIDLPTALSADIATLAGTAVTVVITSLYSDDPLPALPVTLALGIVAYFAAKYTLSDFILVTQSQGLAV